MNRINGEAMNLPVSRLYPNPWNPNVMDADMLARERASIEEFGFVDQIIVRTHPERPGVYEIIDGEHRWLVANELGMEEVPCWNLGEIDDNMAMQLTLVLREIHGTHDPARVQEILKLLVNSTSIDKLRKTIPYDDGVFARLADMNKNFDWSAFEKKAQQPAEPVSRETRHWVERLFRVSDDTAAVLDRALATAKEQLALDNDDEALAAIAVDFLAE
jgi:hypothetical protein